MGDGRAPGDEEKMAMKNASSVTSEEPAEVKVPKPFYRRKSCQLCCGVSTAALLALAILILILSLTVFKAKDPRITVTGVSLTSFRVDVDKDMKGVELDVNLHVNVTVKNPNVASFRYENSSTLLYYRGREVGSAAISAGKVLAKQTAAFETDLIIKRLRILFDANVTADLKAGIIPVRTFSRLKGRLNIIDIFKHHAVSTSDCTANIVVANTTLQDFHCDYTLKM